MLDVLKKYKVWGFCGLGLNRLKSYQTNTWDIMSNNYIADRAVQRSGQSELLGDI